MKNIFVAMIAGLILLGCDDYPGHQPVTNDAMVKMAPKPIWGDVIDQKMVPGGDCHIDSINDKPGEGSSSHSISRSKSALNVAGWGAISVKDGVTASHIAVALKSNSPNGARYYATTTKIYRPDVAEYFKNPASVDTGFSAVINLSDVQPGNYVLEVIQHRDGKNFKCQFQSNIAVLD